MISIVSAISTDTIGIIVLFFTIILLKRNSSLEKLKINQFIFTCELTLIIICLEIASIILTKSISISAQIPHKIVNILGFSLSPLVALSLAFLLDDNLFKHRFKLAIPLYLQAIVCVLSFWNGWIFSVSSSNEYTRGPLFLLNLATSLYTFAVFVYAHNQKSREYDYDEKIYIGILYVIVVIGNIIQIIFPNVFLIWNCVSIAILLYYIFLQELQFKYDPLTKVRNRISFEKMMLEMQKIDTVGIVVLDLNDLKCINDTLGHLEGDKYISRFANIIKICFQDIGITYRIGGDEFCVFCKQVDERRLKAAFNVLDSLATKQSTSFSKPLSIAYGYDIYKKLDSKDIYECFANADSAMYAHKMILKK